MTKSLLFLLALLTAVESQSCNTGAFYSAKFDKCYQFFTTPSRYEFAEEQCTTMGGHLASIRNGLENGFILTKGADALSRSNYSDFWIGLNDLEVSGKWAWTDETIFGYENWKSGQPQTGTDCVSQDKSDGTWSAIGCSSNRPYVCTTPPINPVTCPPIITSVPITCPPTTPCSTETCVPSCDVGWTYFAPTDSCYKVYHNKNWNDAEVACVLLNAHLTSIHSEVENKFVNNLSACGVKEGKPNNLAWIGLSKAGQDWVWSDGTPSDYINWAPKQPDNPGKENCVETAPDLSHDKWYENWNNYECNIENRAYICKKASIHA